MKRFKTVEGYIEGHEKWSKQLKQLRGVLQQTELKEEVKWGAPAYTLNGKILMGLGAFKNHMGLWFHQGVFLKDTHQKLVNAQEGKTKALRQWRIEEGDTIDNDLILQYALETIENCLAGKEVKPVKAKTVATPPLLKKSLSENKKFQDAFKALTPGKQREYAAYIGDAKRDETKQKRLEKIIPMVQAGTGLHDKYKNC